MAQTVAGTTGMKDVRKDAETLTKRVSTWVWIRGAVALVFGIVLLAFPELSLAALVLTLTGRRLRPFPHGDHYRPKQMRRKSRPTCRNR